jgi:hypothetical protein
LFSGSADRMIELGKWSGIPEAAALVDIAVTHGLGDAPCQEKNERLVNEYGKELRAGKIPQWKNAVGMEGSPASK